MKSRVPNTIFVRLFLLLFFTHILNVVVVRLLLPPSMHPHPFRLTGFLLMLTGIAVAAWVAARWLSGPIQRMARAAHALGENLNSPPLAENTGSVEVRQASAVFNQMQVRLNSQIAERSRFLAAVSHDLRTPLTRLRLRAEKIDDPQLKSSIREDVDEMTAMIDAALDYLRGTGQPEAPRLLDITALVQSLADNAEERGGMVTVSGSASPIHVQPGGMRRCVNNLLENALRYGERAWVAIEEAADRVVISIRDAGPGIPEDKLEAVFAPFFRLEDSRNRNTGGIGLGLSIARDIALQHGGSLVLRNDPHGGLIATLTLRK